MELKIEFCNKIVSWNEEEIEVSINKTDNSRIEIHILEYTDDIVNIDKTNIEELEREISNNNGYIKSKITLAGKVYEREIYYVEKIGYKAKDKNRLRYKNYYTDTKLTLEAI